MIQIYFDNELIDEDKYSSLSTNFELFDTFFKLGTTASNTFKLSVGKEAITTHPSEVRIYDDSVLVATLTVDNIEEDDYSYTYTLTDKMVNLEFYYDASLIFVNGHATLLDIAIDICTKAGITLATTDFRGYDKDISWYDNTRTAREYIGYIAELNGGYAQIGTDGRLYFLKQKTNSAKTISIDDCKDFKIGERKEITRVVYELGTLKYEYGNETGNTLYLNSDNVFITEASEVEAIYNEIQGFVFYNFTTTDCPIDFNIKAGQVITFVDQDNNEYPTIAGYELTYYRDWYGGYSLEIESTKQEETQVISTDKRIKNLKIIVDRDSNEIKSVIEQTTDKKNPKSMVNQVSEVKQTVDELKSKISDIADITTSAESIHASVSLDGINESEPIELKIHPITQNITYLYPRNNLYPSDTLYLTNRIIRFIRTYEEDGQTFTENIDYELPEDLLYYDSENYDEFYLNYDSQTCQVIKRCELNSLGVVESWTALGYPPEIDDFPYPQILLGDGDYEVKILGYETGYISARLMAKNIYTSQFYTKVETDSKISQTASQIDLSVNQKLSNYSTTTQMNSAISLSANNITSTVSQTYATKTELNTTKSQIKQTTDAISLEVEGKLDEQDFTSANIILALNSDGSTAKIKADKISLDGKEINLTSGNTTIKSNNFNVDKNGNIRATNANITGTITSTNATINGGVIELISNASEYNDAQFKFKSGNTKTFMSATELEFFDGNSTSIAIDLTGTYMGGNYLSVITPDLDFGVNSEEVYTTGNMMAQDFIKTSLAEKKKDFEKFNNALDIIKNTDIYKYHYKNQEENTKKDIGLVIGDDYKYSQELTNNENNAVNISNVAFVCMRAIQEQQEIIESLEARIKELEEGK